MNSRPKQPKYARNKNILVIGGSGSGKTRFFVKPSLMDGEMRDFAARTLAKVVHMTEAEFAGLALYPADEV